MDLLQNLAMGFGVALTPANLLFLFLGSLAGVIIGALPGLNASMGVAILMPLTFGMDPITGMIMLCGIYTGAMFGGSITAILVNVPGTSAAAVTCLDGYQLARKGRAGAALGMTAFASAIAGVFSVVVLMTMAPALAKVALKFGPPEYFALCFFGLTIITSLAGKSMIKGIIAGTVGLILATVGVDPVGGVNRFTFGKVELMEGFNFIAVLVGIFAVAEVLVTMERSLHLSFYDARVSGLLGTKQDWKDSRGAFVRGSIIGTLVGILPGAGATIASFLAYAEEKRWSRHPEKFGTGVIEGVAAPEAANNAATGGALVPLLTLGIPGSETTAVMLGALLVHGLRPGPLLFTQQPQFVWGVIASLYVGNLIGLLLCTVFVRQLAKVLKVPNPILMPLILAFCFVGTYAVNNSLTDVWIMLVFGVLGYLMKKFDFPAAPVVLALVLGPMVENSLRQSLLMSQGNLGIFFTRPISTVLLALAFLSLFTPVLGAFREAKQKAVAG